MNLIILNDEKKMYEFLKGYLIQHQYQEALKSLYYAIEKHEGTYRKNGLPYIVHPFYVACFGIYLGLNSEKQIAVNLLHDVPEDCEDDLTNLDVALEIKKSAHILNFNPHKKKYPNDKHQATIDFYNLIPTDKEATMCKLLDRYHNLSTYGNDFPFERVLNYSKETNEFIFPLCDNSLELYPHYRFAILYLVNGMQTFIRDADAKAIGEKEKARKRLVA